MVIPALPETPGQFMEMRKIWARTPEGAAALTVLAFKLYMDNPDRGLACVVSMMDRNAGLLVPDVPGAWEGLSPSPYLRGRLANLGVQPFIADSYFLESRPETGYVLPSPPWTVRVMSDGKAREDAGKVKVFVQCSGASLPRPVELRRSAGGLWLADGISSLVMRVAPAHTRQEDLVRPDLIPDRNGSFPVILLWGAGGLAVLVAGGAVFLLLHRSRREGRGTLQDMPRDSCPRTGSDPAEGLSEREPQVWIL